MKTIEALQPEDLETVSALRPEHWGGLAAIHEFYLNNTSCFPHKLVVEDRIVGIGTAIAFHGTGWLAHIIVAEKERRNGYGGSIVAFLMHFLKTKCVTTTVSLIATDLGYPVYLKYGFTVQSEYVSYETEKDAPEKDTDVRIVPITAPRYGAVLDLDKAASGEDRAGVLMEHLEDGYMYVSNDEVTGFFLPSLGEGLLVAKEKEAASALLKKKLAGGCKKVSLPAQNIDGARYLKESEFTETKRLRRMSYGGSFAWHPEFIYGRIGGYLG